jgi:hypothetical protein
MRNRVGMRIVVTRRACAGIIMRIRDYVGKAYGGRDYMAVNGVVFRACGRYWGECLVETVPSACTGILHFSRSKRSEVLGDL